MPVLLAERDVKLERTDLQHRIVLPHTVKDGYIVPPSRSAGLHLSGLIKYVAEKTRITQYIKDAGEEDAIEKGLMPLRWCLGHAWEEFAASLYPEMVWQPGEISEPLIMNCDGLTEDENGIVVHEFKFSRGKYKPGPELLKHWVWMQQGLGYCLGYGGSGVTQRVKWHVLSAMNWPDPKYTTYLVEFSSKDLDGTRRMIDTNRDSAINNGYGE
jgi:hypothetical protein